MGLTFNTGLLSDAIKVSSTLNVGIGTSSPSELLHLYGANPYFLLQGSEASAKTLYIRESAGGMFFGEYGVATRMMISSSGNVGIGTSSPANYFTTTLTIDGSSSQGIMFRQSGTDRGYSYWSSDFMVYGANTGGVIFKTADTERMRITSAGNVCIGTTTSSGYGNVNLDLNAGTLPAAYFVIKTSSNSVIAEYALDSGAAYLSTKTNHSIRIRTNDIERMRINDGNGEVLMHSTSFNSALDGQLFGSGGDTYFTRTNGNVLWLNRRSSNGQLLIFQVDNSMTGYISTNTYSLPSDINFKKNISDLQLGLNLVNKLRSVSYNHITDDKNSPLSTGFIAQEMEKSLTELGVNKNEYFMLQHNPNNNPKESDYWLDYTKMIPVLVKAIQELSAKVTALENK